MSDKILNFLCVIIEIVGKFLAFAFTVFWGVVFAGLLVHLVRFSFSAFV